MSGILISDALLNISLLREDFFLSAFPGKVVFGEILEYNYPILKSFVICRSEYINFYKSIEDIVTVIASNSVLTQDETGLVLSKDSCQYMWLVKKDLTYVIFRIIDNTSSVCYAAPFTLNEFHNLLEIFSEILLSSLLLNNNAYKILKKICNLSLKEIVKYCEKPSLYLKNHCDENFISIEIPNLCILIKNSTDVIIITHKLSKLPKVDHTSIILGLIDGPSKKVLNQPSN